MIVGIDYEVRSPLEHELVAVQQLRHAVLDPARDKPSDLTLGPKDFDPRAIHAAAFDGEQVVSTVRLDREKHGVYVVRKMATHPDYRGQGIGGAVLSHAEVLAFRQGGRSFMLDSREGAIQFYTDLGYRFYGDEVSYNGLSHYTMWKKGLAGGR